MWRSLLFVPILNDRLVDSAHRQGADAIVLDLEAAVPPQRKEEARGRLNPVVSALKTAGVSVAVRINSFRQDGSADIARALSAGADLIVLPLASPQHTARAAAEAGPNVPLIPLIETPRGVIEALAIAEAAQSVAAIGFGVEDYATQMGASPTPTLLVPAAFQVIQAARAANRSPLVLPDTIADYRDLIRFEAAAAQARAMGASGGFAIHPGQVGVLNKVFTPTQAEQDTARAVVAAAARAQAQGDAVATLNGQMIDAPVVARANAVLARVRQR